jgi:hypothetical protein
MTTHRKLPKQPIDDEKSTFWSIAFLSSVGGGIPGVKGGSDKKGGSGKGAAMAVFDLFTTGTQIARTG